jgi:hypothetical protein
MPDTLLNILGFGLIGGATDGSEYRYIIFEDKLTGHKVDYFLNKKQKPQLWSDIEKLENEKKSPGFKGFIIPFRGKEFIVAGDESLQEALAKQNLSFKILSKISYQEVENMRLESKGYCTNLTPSTAMEIGWKPVDQEARIIRYRYYSGKGIFSWSNWYEIEG